MARSRWILFGIAGALALAGTGFLAAGSGVFGGAVEQPIAFPHDVHAGANQIPCMYCHFSADRSPSAGIPPVSVCAGCHMPGSQAGDENATAMVAADREGVQQLLEYWQNDNPIPWARIHDLPDHVQFPHMMHVNALADEAGSPSGTCQQCHGPVETMAEVEQVAPLRMGWCIDCHQERQARIDCSVCHY